MYFQPYLSAIWKLHLDPPRDFLLLTVLWLELCMYIPMVKKYIIARILHYSLYSENRMLHA